MSTKLTNALAAQTAEVEHQLQRLTYLSRSQIAKSKIEFVSFLSALESIKEYVEQDNYLLEQDLRSKGIPPAQIIKELNKSFKPTIENLQNLILEIKKSGDFQFKMLKSRADVDLETLKHADFKSHLKLVSGDLHISFNLLIVILAKVSNLGTASLVAYLSELQGELGKLPATIQGQNKIEQDYVGYSKAIYADLTTLLADFEFIDEQDYPEGFLQPHKLQRLEHFGLLKSLTSKGLKPILDTNGATIDNKSDFITFAEKLSSEGLTRDEEEASMRSLGFTTLKQLGGLELISLWSLGLKPSPYLSKLIVSGDCKILVETVKVNRGESFKFETIQMVGHLWKEFYNVCLIGSVKTKKHNQC